MKSDENSNVSRNNSVMSQFCSLNIEKNVRKSNGVGFFGPIKKVFEGRAKAWDQLFKKFEKDTNEEEISIDKLTSEEEEDETREYYEKDSTPMRKSSTLVQYWIDTGNPPYCAILDDAYFTDPGSSFSEDEKSKSGELPPNHQEKPGETTSVYTSVDTAVYIRSNTNVTERAEAIAIVEGSKVRESPGTTENYHEKKQFSGELDIASEISKRSHEEMLLSSVQQKDHIEHLGNEIEDSDESESEMISQRSMKIADVLPVLEHFDKIMSPRYNTLSRRPLKSRKLYTGRDSPIDILGSAHKSYTKLKIENHVHPAFLTTPLPASKKIRTKSRLTMAIQNRTRNRSKEKNSVVGVRRTSKRVRLTRFPNPEMNDQSDETEDKTELNETEKSDGEMKNLIALCSEKRLVVSLNRIPVEFLTSGKNDLLKGEVPHEKKTNTFQGKTKLEKIDIDSQLKDQSTTILYQLRTLSSTESSSTKQSTNFHHKKTQDRKTFFEMESKSSHQKKEDESNRKKRRKMKAKRISIKKQTDNSVIEEFQRILNHEPESSNENKKTQKISKITKGISYAHTITDSSSDDSIFADKSPRRETRRTFTVKPTISFSSDEEDEFVKMMESNHEKLAKSKKPSSFHEDLIRDLTDPEPTVTNVFVDEPTDPDLDELVSKSKQMIRKRSNAVKPVRRKSNALTVKFSENESKIDDKDSENSERKTFFASANAIKSTRKPSLVQKVVQSNSTVIHRYSESSKKHKNDSPVDTIQSSSRESKINYPKDRRKENNHKDQNEKESPTGKKCAPVITEDVILNDVVVSIQNSPKASPRSPNPKLSSKSTPAPQKTPPSTPGQNTRTMKSKKSVEKIEVLSANDAISEDDVLSVVNAAEPDDKNRETGYSERETLLPNHIDNSFEDESDKKLELNSKVGSNNGIAESVRKNSYAKKVKTFVKEKRSIARTLEYSFESSDSDASEKISGSPIKKMKLDDNLLDEYLEPKKKEGTDVSVDAPQLSSNHERKKHHHKKNIKQKNCMNHNKKTSFSEKNHVSVGSEDTIQKNVEESVLNTSKSSSQSLSRKSFLRNPASIQNTTTSTVKRNRWSKEIKKNRKETLLSQIIDDSYEDDIIGFKEAAEADNKKIEKANNDNNNYNKDLLFFSNLSNNFIDGTECSFKSFSKKLSKPRKFSNSKESRKNSIMTFRTKQTSDSDD